jgi:hypothetical protein
VIAELVDVALASMGYLRGPDGRLRHVPGLDQIARDTLRLGVDVAWGQPDRGEVGSARLWSGLIILAPRTFDGPGWALRDLWSHELAHCTTGSVSCARARAVQELVYGELLEPLDFV